MTEKSLQSVAIDFKGKKYVLVADRISYFNANYPKGSIKTDIVSSEGVARVIIRATVSTGEGQEYVAHSQARWDDANSFVNKSAALENAETSAVGRALAFMGIGVVDSIASMDEINKAKMDEKINPVNEELQQLRQWVIDEVSAGRSVSAEEFEEACANSSETSALINAAKNKWKREHPQPLRNPDMERGKLAAVRALQGKLKAQEIVEDKTNQHADLPDTQ